MSRILLVEDDRSLGPTLQERLVKDGHEVVLAVTCEDSLQALASSSFDLIVLDVGLPDGSGFEVADRVRKMGSLPMIFVTAQSGAEERLRGYELGADEYIPKPFHLREFLIRVNHVLKNHAPLKEVQLGELVLNLDSFECHRKGVKQEVATRDIRVLKLLMERRPRVVSRDEVLNQVWGEDQFPTQRTVDNAILRLRGLLGPFADCIKSVRGVGYRWEDQE